MKRTGLIVAALATLLALPAVTKAAVENPWELTLGGGASNSNDFDGFTGNLQGQIGYYFNDNLELALRQSVTYSDIGTAGGGSAWSGSSRLALDLHFPLGDPAGERRYPMMVPFIGANIGYVYGDAVVDTWAAAPEAGLKVYLDSRTFLFVMAEYQFFFKDAGDADSAFNDGAFVYSIGLGFRF